jgi:hypothetical protein
MKKFTLLALVMGLTLTTSGVARAGSAWHGSHHGHHRYQGGYGHHRGYAHHGYHGGHIGVYLSAPLFWNPYVNHYAYWPAPVLVERQPQIYVQQQGLASAPNYWYFCPDTRTYYPYAQNCPSAWLKVLPENSPQPPAAP